jgi:NADH:ubiquinone oxidoreductase subunit 4 (subunit M)
MKNKITQILIILLVTLVAGQGLAALLNFTGYLAFLTSLRLVLSQIAFWGPIIAIIAAVFIFVMMRLLGFNTIEEIRSESVEQNNPAPAIIFVGTLIASLLFLTLVIRP